MKALKLSALILGASLFLGLGSTTLSAEGMKCGSAMKAPQSCNDKRCATDEKCVCEENGNKCTCTHNDDKKEPKKAMKCGGAGKCG